MQRVLDGAIGDIVTIETVYNTGSLWHRGRQPDWSEMEYQIRNWLYFTWLSGDHITEQAIHSIDKMGWAMHDEPPKEVWGVGGRQVRTGEQYGNVYDHFSLVYEYANGVRGYHQCRQMGGTRGRVKDYIFGTKGVADVFGHKLTDHSGKELWHHDGKATNMYDAEHIELFKSIRENRPINNGVYMCRSTMLAIMGRMAAYTGQNVTWEQAMNSTESLSPEKYDWFDVPTPAVAMPGITKLI
jgi:predicted dehydrogenase